MHHCPGQGPELCRAVISGFISRGCCAGKVFGGEGEGIIDPDFRLDAEEAEVAEIDAEGRGFGDGDFGWVWVDLIMIFLPEIEPTPSAVNQDGWQLYAG